MSDSNHYNPGGTPLDREPSQRKESAKETRESSTGSTRGTIPCFQCPSSVSAKSHAVVVDVFLWSRTFLPCDSAAEGDLGFGVTRVGAQSKSRLLLPSERTTTNHPSHHMTLTVSKIKPNRVQCACCPLLVKPFHCDWGCLNENGFWRRPREKPRPPPSALHCP